MDRKEKKEMFESFKARKFADEAEALIDSIRDDENMQEALICLLMDDCETKSHWLISLRAMVHSQMEEEFEESLDPGEEADPRMGWLVRE